MKDFPSSTKKVFLIDYSTFFGLIKRFKFLLLIGSDLLDSDKFAVTCRNTEITKLRNFIHHLKGHVNQRFDFIGTIYFDIFMKMKYRII